MVALIRAAFTLVFMKQYTYFYMSADDRPDPTPEKCAAICLTNEFCGGFQYVPRWPIPCFMMVHKDAPGSSTRYLLEVKMFKMVDIGEGSLKQYELVTMAQSFNSARQGCLDHGMELVPLPTNRRDIITLGLAQHNCSWVDLQRQDDGTYSDAKKQLTEAELGIDWKSGEPTGGDEKCVAVCNTKGIFELEDRLCDGSETIAVHCVMEV